MKEAKKNHRNLLAVNAVCHRILKVMREKVAKGSDRWTPFEGVPVSVSMGELRRREVPGKIEFNSVYLSLRFFYLCFA